VERENMMHLFDTRGQSEGVSPVPVTTDASRLPRQVFPTTLGQCGLRWIPNSAATRAPWSARP
jgi:hypothetical protein